MEKYPTTTPRTCISGQQRNLISKLTSTTIINFLLLYVTSRWRTWKVSRLRTHWTPACSILNSSQATLRWAPTSILTPTLFNSPPISSTSLRYNPNPVSTLTIDLQYHLQGSKSFPPMYGHQKNLPTTSREMGKEDNSASSPPIRNYQTSHRSTMKPWATCRMRSTCDQLRCRVEGQPRVISVT